MQSNEFLKFFFILNNNLFINYYGKQIYKNQLNGLGYNLFPFGSNPLFKSKPIQALTVTFGIGIFVLSFTDIIREKSSEGGKLSVGL